MTIETTRFDPMEHLDNNEDYIDLLNEALATGDPRVFVRAIGEVARGRGMTDLARATGIGRSSLYKAMADDANPTLETLMKVLDGLHIQLRAQAEVAA